MSKHLVHPFVYFSPRKAADRKLGIAETRDDAASREIVSALTHHGYALGETLYNYPPPIAPGCLLPPSELHKVDTSFLRARDLILLLTRPPMSDHNHGDRRQIEPGNTDLEQSIFRAWHEHADVIARSHVSLTDSAQRLLRPGFETRRDMAFYMSKGAPYKELNAHDGRGWRKPSGPRRTAAFLLRVNALREGGPGLLCAFGMDGHITRVWAYLLRVRFPELLEKQGLTIAELDCEEIPERPTDLRWARDLRLEVITRS